MKRKPLPQLFTVEETNLVENFRACCSHHKRQIKALTTALRKHCSSVDTPTVIPFIKTKT